MQRYFESRKFDYDIDDTNQIERLKNEYIPTSWKIKNLILPPMKELNLTDLKMNIFL